MEPELEFEFNKKPTSLGALFDLFVRQNQHIFMDKGNVAEVTYLQSAKYFKVWQTARKHNSLYFPEYMQMQQFGWNVPNFHVTSTLLYGDPFQDIEHFTIFQLTAGLKF